MTYILAGNGSEAEDFVAKQKLPVKQYVIVHGGLQKVRKRDTDKLALVGTWKLRPDLEELRKVLKPLGIEVPEA